MKEKLTTEERFGLKIKALRKAHNMTLSELAAQLGVQNTSIAQWEKGSRLPSVENIKKLAKLANVTVTRFMYVTEKDLKKVLKHADKH